MRVVPPPSPPVDRIPLSTHEESYEYLSESLSYHLCETGIGLSNDHLLQGNYPIWSDTPSVLLDGCDAANRKQLKIGTVYDKKVFKAVEQAGVAAQGILSCVDSLILDFRYFNENFKSLGKYLRPTRLTMKDYSSRHVEEYCQSITEFPEITNSVEDVGLVGSTWPIAEIVERFPRLKRLRLSDRDGYDTEADDVICDLLSSGELTHLVLNMPISDLQLANYLYAVRKSHSRLKHLQISSVSTYQRTHRGDPRINLENVWKSVKSFFACYSVWRAQRYSNYNSYEGIVIKVRPNTPDCSIGGLATAQPFQGEVRIWCSNDFIEPYKFVFPKAGESTDGDDFTKLDDKFVVLALGVKQAVKIFSQFGGLTGGYFNPESFTRTFAGSS